MERRKHGGGDLPIALIRMERKEAKGVFIINALMNFLESMGARMDSAALKIYLKTELAVKRKDRRRT